MVKDPTTNAWVERTQFLDSCGAFNMISRSELHDIRPASQYGMRPMRMRTIEETTSWYQDVGKSYARDASGNTLVRLAYAYDNQRKSEDPFYLICLSTIVEEGIDSNYHNRESCAGRVPMLRRVAPPMTENNKKSQAKLAKPMGSGKPKPKVGKKGKARRSRHHESLLAQLEVEELAWQIHDECQCKCTPRVVRDMAYEDYQAMVEDINPRRGPQSTSFQLDNTQDNQPYQLHDCDDLVRAAFPAYAPVEELSAFDAGNYRCYMTEIQLQAIVNQQGIESSGSSDLDMTLVDGVSSPSRRRALPLAPRALIAEFDLRSDLDSESDSEGEGGDEEGFFGEGGSLGSDYDSDDNSTTAQVHRFFAKVEGLGIDLGEDMFSDPWA